MYDPLDKRFGPGAGLVTPTQEHAWAEILSMLPKGISRDSTTQFCNPALLEPLSLFLQEMTAQSGQTRITQRMYWDKVEDAFEGEKIALFLRLLNKQIKDQEMHPFHGGLHLRVEVPQRMRIILAHLKEDVLTPTDKGILWCLASAHDLAHSGLTYAQRSTPGVNISNEERAAIEMVKHALDAGFNPIQILEMQRVLLTTSFFQSEKQLKLKEDMNARVSYAPKNDLDFSLVDHQVWTESDFAKRVLSRPYDPSLLNSKRSRDVAKLLCLADIFITLNPFEEMVARGGDVYREAKQGAVPYPTNEEQFVTWQMNFIRDYVLPRLRSCAVLLQEGFYSAQKEKLHGVLKKFGEIKKDIEGGIEDAKVEAERALIKSTVHSYAQ